jgi:hypothetical protein
MKGGTFAHCGRALDFSTRISGLQAVQNRTPRRRRRRGPTSSSTACARRGSSRSPTARWNDRPSREKSGERPIRVQESVEILARPAEEVRQRDVDSDQKTTEAQDHEP